MSEVPEAPKRAVVLNEQRLQQAKHARQDWIVNAEEGQTLDDVMDAAYWSHVSQRMQQFDRIEVRMETGEWVADLIVIGVGRNWMTTHLIAKHDLKAPSPPVASIKHKVLWRGNQHKFCVKRLSDSEILQANFASQREAEDWLLNYEQTISKT